MIKRKLSKKLILQLAEVAHKQTVASSLIEGIVVSENAKPTKEEIFDMWESQPGFDGWAEDDD